MRMRFGWLGISLVSVAVACSGATELGEVQNDDSGDDDGSSNGDDGSSNGDDDGSSDSGGSSSGEDDGGSVETVSVSSTGSGSGGSGSEDGWSTSEVTTVSTVSGSGGSGSEDGSTWTSSTGHSSGGFGGTGEVNCETAITVSAGVDNTYSAVSTTSPCSDTTTGGWTGNGVGGTEGSTGSVTTVSTTGGLTTTGGTTSGPAPSSCAPGEGDCSGLCFGTACDGEWQCHASVICSGAEVAWCGCDGETFYSFSDCPQRAFVHIGECE